MFPQMNIVNEIFISSQKNENEKMEKMGKKIESFWKKNRKKIEKKNRETNRGKNRK